jgi:amidohydrolase
MQEANRFPEITEADLEAAIRLRHDLHRLPEVSGEEAATAARIAHEMRELGADEVVTDLGGHGVAAIFEGKAPGPAIAFRAELDALPILETGTPDYASEVPGTGHLCGHDGHMSILYSVARALSRDRPERGRAILIFQPAEETGAGAVAMLKDPRTHTLAPDWVFSLHNLPGMAHGRVALADGPAACASRGMRIRLKGREAHASQPQEGISPRMALSRLLRDLPALGTDAPLGDPRFAMVTVTHCRMGAQAFGIAPGEGEIWATLRTLRNPVMADLVARAEALADTAATESGLIVAVDYSDVFDATENHPEAAQHLREAMDLCGVPHGSDGQPWAPSEDFGQFAALAPSAMLFLGAGEERPALHNPDYDFPDTLIPVGAGIFLQTLRNMTAADR